MSDKKKRAGGRTHPVVMLVSIALITAACTSTPDGESSATSAPASSTAETAAPGPGAMTLTGGESIEGKTVFFQIYTGPDTPFWVPVVAGAEAAAAILGVDLEIVYANADDATQVNQIQTAVAKDVLGIATGLPNTAAANAVCDARDAGIPVVAFNVNSLEGDDARCIEAFMGQDFVTAGAVIAQRMVDEGLVEGGDTFFCPVEAPTAVYAVQRHEGVMTVFEPIGAACELVGVGTDPAAARDTMVQYLLGHPDTHGIVGLGAVPLTEASAAADQVELSDMPIGGFDLSETILEDIASGRIIATVDQQPFSQGFYAVMQLGLQGRYELYPSSMATGGFGLVDQSNVDAVESLVPDYR